MFKILYLFQGEKLTSITLLWLKKMTSNYLAVICIYNFLKLLIPQLFCKLFILRVQIHLLRMHTAFQFLVPQIFIIFSCISWWIVYSCFVYLWSEHNFISISLMPFVVVCSVWYLNYTFCSFFRISKFQLL